MPSSPGQQPQRPPAQQPEHTAQRQPAPRRVLIDPAGPTLVEGPVEVTLPDGTTGRSERFLVALCTCQRSETYPWCDTSHRRRRRSTPPSERAEQPAQTEQPGHRREPAQSHPHQPDER